MGFDNFLVLVTWVLFSLLPMSISQSASEAPSPAADLCNGVFVSYAYESGAQIPPRNRTNQAYRFESRLTVLNNGIDELKSWRVFVGFQHNERLVSVSNAVLVDGTNLPGSVENGTMFAGFPMTDLKTAIDTAGDVNQMMVQVKLVGTQFKVASPDVPLPVNISLANDGYVCPKATTVGTTEMQMCCTVDPTVKTNITVDGEFLPRQEGDLTIMYDVIRTYDSSYYARVTMENHNGLGRLDNWKLSWDWMYEEFIYSMKGAYPSVIDSTDCISGSQGQQYKDLDFANVLNCQKRPTIIDLPPTKANDTLLGLVPFCCRNGTILPKTMDPKRSKSSFELEVYKMPPSLNRSDLSPPQNWKIEGSLNPDYQCGPPLQVSPSLYPDSSGIGLNRTAFASWQVVCNITQQKGASPKCCVSFSSYYNESVVPCNTCACGCSSNPERTCSTTAQALLLPPQALLIPFENRTLLATTWAELKRRETPKLLPCGDNCGVSLNWHLLSDYNRGWSARITVFNWDETPFPDWFAAVQLDNATVGFEKAYSFNGTTLLRNGVNNTIFMQGLPGLNYIVGEIDSDKPERDPRVPGKQQSVISFTKKLTPDIKVSAGDGFPTKVFFNGEECSLPNFLPTSHGDRKVSATTLSVLAVVIMTLFLL